jgi:DNA-binding MurR/RpiR family transcriptional regulator
MPSGKSQKQHKQGGHYTPIFCSDQLFHQRFAMANALREQATRSAAISSTSAQMMLTDLLFMGLVQQDLERAAAAGR